MARRCIFCGNAPVTLEHVWPQWLLRRYRVTGLVRTGPRPVAFSKRSMEIAARCVCKPCNNGWMSELENRARPWLEPMVDGAPTVLDSAAQFAVAAWATKTAMVFEHTLSLPATDIYWRQEERVAFQQPPHIPPGDPGDATNIRIATFRGSRLFLVRAGTTHLAALGAPDIPVARATRATMQVGRLALQVESHRWREATGRTGWLTGTGFGTFLWPERQPLIQWPIVPALDDANLETFAGGL